MASEAGLQDTGQSRVPEVDVGVLFAEGSNDIGQSKKTLVDILTFFLEEPHGVGLADAFAAGQINQTDGGGGSGEIFVSHFQIDPEHCMGPGRGKVDIIAGKLPPGFPFIEKPQRLVFALDLGLSEVLDDDILLAVISDLQILRHTVLAEQVDDVFVVDLEVTEAHPCHHFLSLDATEDLPCRQGDQARVALHSLHGVGLAGRSLSIGKDAGCLGERVPLYPSKMCETTGSMTVSKMYLFLQPSPKTSSSSHNPYYTKNVRYWPG